MNVHYLDTEYDGKDLVSIAIVPEHSHSPHIAPLYAIVKDRDIRDAWVRENVIPHLDYSSAEEQRAIGIDRTRFLVAKYLRRAADYNVSTIVVADWWTDITHLMRLIDHGDGTSEDVPEFLSVVARGFFRPDRDHNALRDAISLRDDARRVGWKPIKDPYKPPRAAQSARDLERDW